jgi:2-hydroxychromene-2-carboxylate isomerase
MIRGIDFWFEFASTYSYLSAMRIETVAKDAGIGVAWRPFLLGPIFKKQGWDTSPFNLYPIKGEYMWRDVERHCQRYGIPFKKPAVFPRNSILAARVACIAMCEGWCPEFSRAVFRANFAEDRDISSPEIITEILKSIEKDGHEYLSRIRRPEFKSLLREQTTMAMSLGIFGAPSFIARNELFWGNDRLEDALDWYIGHRKEGMSS